MRVIEFLEPINWPYVIGNTNEKLAHDILGELDNAGTRGGQGRLLELDELENC
jgi:hypothetical protein